MTQTLADKFRNLPQKGTGQHKIAALGEKLDVQNGKLLVEAVDELACHTAQLAVEMAKINVIRSYKDAVVGEPVTSHPRFATWERIKKTPELMNPKYVISIEKVLIK